MPKAEVRTTPDQWKRVGVETQESRFHRVHAQRDFVDDTWRFVAVRRGDGIHPCKVLGQHETAAAARAQCEADEYTFHWPDPDRGLERRALGLKTSEQLELHERDKEERRAGRSVAKKERKFKRREESWKQ